MEIKNYPRGYSAGPDGIYYHGEHFSNALIEITDYYEVKSLTAVASGDCYVEVAFKVGEKTYPAVIPYIGLEKLCALFLAMRSNLIKEKAHVTIFCRELLKGLFLIWNPESDILLPKGIIALK